MTVSTTTRLKTFIGDDVTDTFAFDFETLDAADIEAYEDGVQDTNITVILNANQTANPGGTCKFDTAPPANASVVSILRNVTADQQISYPLGGNFPSASHEKGLDKLTMLVQEAEALANLGLHFPAYESGLFSSEIPKAADRLGKYLTFDNSGNLSVQIDGFNYLYLGPKTSAPTTDNDGNALIAGMLYFHTPAGASQGLWSYNGSAWVIYNSSAATSASLVSASDAGNYFIGSDLELITQEIGKTIAIHDQVAGAFNVYEITPPEMRLFVAPGRIQSGTTFTSVALQITGVFTAPTTNPRIDRIVIDDVTGLNSVITGTEAASPVAPALTSGKIAVAQVLLQTTTTFITDSMITDERSVFNTPAIKTKVVDIGDWDMVANATKSVAHGLSASYTVVGVSALIQDDSSTSMDDFSTAFLAGQTGSSVLRHITTWITLTRAAGGMFDSTAYDTATSFNRGTILIRYID